jgi:diguanylate cyclase (GGDEF)-like protein
LQKLATYTDTLKTESQKYKELSTTDALTGALNRNGLSAFLAETCPNNALPDNTALMIVDLDHFKRINDKKGHDTGDKVLSSVCTTIKNTIRTKDLFVRWGGEEFVLICPDTDSQGTPLVAEKVRSAVANLTLEHNGSPFKVSVSIGAGVATMGETFDELFRRADSALYQAKNLGRNCVVVA